MDLRVQGSSVLSSFQGQERLFLCGLATQKSPLLYKNKWTCSAVSAYYIKSWPSAYHYVTQQRIRRIMTNALAWNYVPAKSHVPPQLATVSCSVSSPAQWQTLLILPPLLLFGSFRGFFLGRLCSRVCQCELAHFGRFIYFFCHSRMQSSFFYNPFNKMILSPCVSCQKLPGQNGAISAHKVTS